MLSATEIVLEYVCPAAGMVAANIMFSAPYRDVLKATSETGQLGDLNPTPWGFMLGNCLGWVVYSLLIQNLFVFFANAPGFVLSVWLNMAAVKLQYENHKRSSLRTSLVGALQHESSRRITETSKNATRSESLKSSDKETVDDGNYDDNPRDEEGKVAQPDHHNHHHHNLGDFAHVVWEVTAQHQAAPAPHERLVLGMVLYWLIVVSVVGFGDHVLDQDVREMVVGTAVNLNLVFFYGAPLSTIATVLQTASSSSIHIPTMLTNTANGIFWCAYGIAVLDYFIAVPNGLGAALGGIQMLLCLTFPRSKLPQERQASMDAEEAPEAPRVREDAVPDGAALVEVDE